MRFIDSTARLKDRFSDVGLPMWHVFSSGQRYLGHLMTGHYRCSTRGPGSGALGREAWEDKNQTTFSGPACDAAGLSRRIERQTSKSSACLAGELNPFERIAGRSTEGRRRAYAAARLMHHRGLYFKKSRRRKSPERWRCVWSGMEKRGGRGKGASPGESGSTANATQSYRMLGADWDFWRGKS